MLWIDLTVPGLQSAGNKGIDAFATCVRKVSPMTCTIYRLCERMQLLVVKRTSVAACVEVVLVCSSVFFCNNC